MGRQGDKSRGAGASLIAAGAPILALAVAAYLSRRWSRRAVGRGEDCQISGHKLYQIKVNIHMCTLFAMRELP